MMYLRSLLLRASVATLPAVAVLGVAAGCGGSSSQSSTTTTSTATTMGNVSGSISFDGIWTGAEAKHFRAVIDAFNKQYPNVTVHYKAVGDNIPTVLATAVAGGRPPDMADIAQPGLIQQFVDKGALKPIGYARATVARNFAPAWLDLGTYDGRMYGVVFKASNKSLVWYNVHAFEAAGVKPVTTWAELMKLASTVKASGTSPFSIGGADGWTLTDLFENIYLRQAGLAKYKLLSAHKMKWTDPSVADALTTMGQALKSRYVYGGTGRALQTDFPTSVNNVFQDPPKAAMVMEGDFVPGTATVEASAGADYNVFAFPSIAGSGPAVEVAGDTIVTFRNTPAVRAFETFLATPAAAEAWAKLGGFASGDHNVPISSYPNEILRSNARTVMSAKSIVFDMSDEQPGSFGATVGQGEWGIFQDFLRNPSDVAGTQRRLEASAQAAYDKAG
jgi:hypothetical protein